jgi:hypothetical protein
MATFYEFSCPDKVSSFLYFLSPLLWGLYLQRGPASFLTDGCLRVRMGTRLGIEAKKTENDLMEMI